MSATHSVKGRVRMSSLPLQHMICWRTLVFCAAGLRNQIHGHVRFVFVFAFSSLSLSLSVRRFVFPCTISAPETNFEPAVSSLLKKSHFFNFPYPFALTPPRITCTSFGRPNLQGVNCTGKVVVRTAREEHRCGL
jgi:hypothetical protein